jgi:hypothetical protein
MLILKSVELLITIVPKAPTWRASCRCLTIDSLPRGYLGQLFGLRRMLELNGERRDSQFILVRALDRDRVITLRPVGVSLCVGPRNAWWATAVGPRTTARPMLLKNDKLPLGDQLKKGICVEYAVTVTGHGCNCNLYQTMPYK